MIRHSTLISHISFFCGSMNTFKKSTVHKNLQYTLITRGGALKNLYGCKISHMYLLSKIAAKNTVMEESF